MRDPWKRLAMALLSGFVAFVVAAPVGCGALLLWSQHVYGDVEAGGPSSLLGGMGMAGVLAVMVTVWVWRRGSDRG